MALLWKRKIEAVIGQAGAEGIKISGLRMSFRCEKNSEPKANPSQLKIYNLSENTRQQLRAEIKNQKVIVSVAYGDQELGVLFSGDVAKVITEKSGGDIITTFETGDGEKAINEARIDKSYSAGTNMKTVVEDVANTMKDQAGVIVGNIKNTVKDEVTQNGFTISGVSSAILSSISARQGKEWHIQDNELLYLSPTESFDASDLDAIVLSPSTGLIGQPKKAEVGEKGSEVSGWELKALIQKDIKPAKLIKLIVPSMKIEDLVRVRKAVFEGDTHAQNWYATIQGVIL